MLQERTRTQDDVVASLAEETRQFAHLLDTRERRVFAIMINKP